MNFRLQEDLVDYIEKWHEATGRHKEDVFNHMIRSFRQAVGDPPPPTELPGMAPKPRKPK